MAESFQPPRQVTLPWAFLFAIVCAAASWGGTYVSLNGQIQRAVADNDNQANAIVALSTRIGNMESDERVNAVTRAQLTKEATATATAFGSFQTDVRNRLEQLQTTLIELQVTLAAIREANGFRSPAPAVGRPK